MSRDARFDVLFQPVKIGPVTARNRFYQVPHCTGMGYSLPETLVAMREVKAEGGWGVVNTEYCSIHPSADDLPAPFASLWDDGDTRNLARMAEAVHKHGALAGIELWHGGIRASNLQSRETPLGPVSLPVYGDPWQCAAMDKADLAQLRLWHRTAAKRAQQAGVDVVYVYAAHTYLLAQFLDPVINQRTDEYGGSPANRARLLREIIAETKDAIGDTCAIAIRIEVLNEDESRDHRDALLASLAGDVDLFDVTIPDYSHEMGASRFVKEASIETHVGHIRALVKKPVVSVGRFTSPETMLSQVKRGVIDFIGAARPSIADPFLPIKIREGRFDDIRECIGCNICYAMDARGVAIRCTQNPAMGEEWRRGWHPERVNITTKREKVLLVGGGPAGLEAALTAAKRGFDVSLADANRELGGRLLWESRLPGLSEWIRVRDWRQHQLSKMSNVEVFRESRMDAESIRDFAADHVIVATGSHWRTNGQGRSSAQPQTAFNDTWVISPEAVMAGAAVQGPVVIYDDDTYYVASALAEHMAKAGHHVTYVTSASLVSAWSINTVEQARIHRRLVECGVTIITSHTAAPAPDGQASLKCVYTHARHHIECGTFIPVTSKEPDESLWKAVSALDLPSIHRVGDCRAPGIIAQAVHDGHRIARAVGTGPETVRRDRVLMA